MPMPGTLCWQGEIRVSPELAHLPFAVLGAFSEIEIMGQSFGDNESLVRFTMLPGRETALEAAWQERSRGGTHSLDLRR